MVLKNGPISSGLSAEKKLNALGVTPDSAPSGRASGFSERIRYKAFKDKFATFGSFQDFEDWLVNSVGFDRTRADGLVGEIEDVTTFSSFSTEVSNRQTFTELKTYMTGSLGISNIAVTSLLDPIFQHFDDPGELKDDADDKSSFEEFKDFLINEYGLDPERAEELINKLKNQYADYQSFLDDLDNFSSLEEFLNNAIESEQTLGGDGETFGIRFHEEAGSTKDGVEVPAGTTELFGKEIHFSKTGGPDTTEKQFQIGSLSVSDTVIDPGETVTVSTTVTNNASTSTPVIYVATLVVDGEATQSQTLKIPPNQTYDVEFDVKFTEAGQSDVSIDTAGPTTITIVYPQL